MKFLWNLFAWGMAEAAAPRFSFGESGRAELYTDGFGGPVESLGIPGRCRKRSVVNLIFNVLEGCQWKTPKITFKPLILLYFLEWTRSRRRNMEWEPWRLKGTYLWLCFGPELEDSEKKAGNLVLFLPRAAKGNKLPRELVSSESHVFQRSCTVEDTHYFFGPYRQSEGQPVSALSMVLVARTTSCRVSKNIRTCPRRDPRVLNYGVLGVWWWWSMS